MITDSELLKLSEDWFKKQPINLGAKTAFATGYRLAELRNCNLQNAMWRSGQPCNCAKNDYLTIVDGECICGTCGGNVVLQSCT